MYVEVHSVMNAQQNEAKKGILTHFGPNECFSVNLVGHQELDGEAKIEENRRE